jgi:glycosyltransferase involved in cell wall biosynthesis
MTPLVSIAVPTYRRLHYLKDAVESALQSHYEHIEVLIGDDGPTAEIETWSRALAAREGRVRYQRNSRRMGLAGNWNALCDLARGEWIVIIGDDDRLLPQFIGQLIAAARPETQVIFANHYLIDGEGHRLVKESHAHTIAYSRHLLPPGRVKNALACVWRNSVPMSAALIRTETARRLRFNEQLNTPEIELFLRVALGGGEFIFVPDYLAEYRVHAASETADGLLSERLADCLIALAVPPENETDKRRFLAPVLVNATSRCLLKGEPAEARRFLRSDYYPKAALSPDSSQFLNLGSNYLKLLLSRSIQVCCAAMPTRLGVPAYRAMWRAKAAARKSLAKQ